MARTEAMKQAQRTYRLKIQDGEQYKLNEAKRQRKRYELSRNYKDVKKGNWGTSFKLLYGY